MMRLRSIAAAGAVALLASTSAAQAQCQDLSLDQVPAPFWNSSPTGQYDPFEATRYFQQEDIRVKKAGTGTCDFFITISAGDSGNFNQRRMALAPDILTYNIYDAPSLSANILKDFPESLTFAEVLEGQITSSGEQFVTLSFNWTIDPQQVVPSQAYEDTNVTVSLYEGSIASPTLRSQSTVTLKAEVLKLAEVSLVATGGAFDAADINETVNFGTLTAGAQQSFDLLVRSNSGYLVSFQSAESSTMRKSAPNPDNVSYTVTVGGNPADLSGGSTVVVATASGVTPVNGDRLAVAFTVGTVSGRRTGNYDDNITVTVSAL